MGNLSLDPNKAPTLPGLAHRYLGLTPAKAVTKVGEPAPGPFPGRPVGVAEYRTDPKLQRSRPCPILQLLIARLTIAEQHCPLGVS